MIIAVHVVVKHLEDAPPQIPQDMFGQGGVSVHEEGAVLLALVVPEAGEREEKNGLPPRV